MKPIFQIITFLIIFGLSLKTIAQPKIIIEPADEKQIGLIKDLGKPSEGMARIIFKRQGSIVGAVVPHFVVDRCDSTNFNLVIIQNERFADWDGNFDRVKNVNQMYLLDTISNQFQLILGSPLPDDVALTDEKEIVTIKIEYKNIFSGNEEYNQKTVGFWKNKQPLPANARMVGVVKSGQLIGWERPPGKVKLEVIVPNCDQTFSPFFNAEEGHTYFVDFFYTKSLFKVAETN